MNIVESCVAVMASSTQLYGRSITEGFMDKKGDPMKNLSFLILLSILLSACGGGGGGGTTTPSGGGTTPPPPTFGITGSYIKGPVSGANCELFELNAAGAKGASLGTAQSLNGLIDFGDTEYQGNAIVECTGGTYQDEATGATLTAPLHRAIVVLAGDTSTSVGPLTEIAAQLAEADGGNFNTAVTTHNSAVAEAFGLDGVDITKVIPVDLATEVAGDTPEGRYATVLAILSQVNASSVDEDLEAILADLAVDLADDALSISTLVELGRAVAALPTSDVVGNLTDSITDSLVTGVGILFDADEDGVLDENDAFPDDAAETIDTDGDGTGDNADAFDNDPTETTDTDGDGTGDNADAFPLDPSRFINELPVAVATVSGASYSGNSAVALNSVESSDPDGVIVSFEWQQISGPPIAFVSGNTSPNVFFDAPILDQPSLQMVFELTVTDNDGGSDVAQVSVTIINDLPIAEISGNSTAEELTSFSLDGGSSRDQESDITFQWEQVSGPEGVLTGSNQAIAIIEAPIVNVDVDVTIQLTVTDDIGQTASAIHTVTIKPKAVNSAPTAIANTANMTVDELSTVTIDGSSSSDTDGSIDTHLWSALGCPLNTAIAQASQATTQVTFPVVASSSACTVLLTVTDNDGEPSNHQIDFIIEPLSLSISGYISVPAGTFVDSDVNDTDAAYASNDSGLVAQQLPNPASLGGYLNEAFAGEVGSSWLLGDLDDLFRVNLLAGQKVSLIESDPSEGNLALGLWSSDTLTLEDLSITTGYFETVEAPATGEYVINPAVFSGASNYTLIIGNSSLSSTSGGYSLRNDFVPNEMLVTLSASPNVQIMESKLTTLEANLKLTRQEGGGGDIHLLKTSDDSGLSSSPAQASQILFDRFASGLTNSEDLEKLETLWAINLANESDGVQYAQPNYIYKTQMLPNDPFFELQWHYQNIELPAAWDISTGSSDVTVAVVDTGVLLSHPDMQGQLVSGYDFVSSVFTSADGDGIDSDPDDPGDGTNGTPSSFHGTHVAGTIAAASNNSIGTAGIAWGSKVMPVRVLGAGGGTINDILEGVKFAAGLSNISGTTPLSPADIINLSLGGIGPCSPAEQEVYSAARAAGSIIVVAAGNDGIDASNASPANCEDVITVSATNMSNELASYSNFGASLDIAAPGGDFSDINGDGYPDGVLSLKGDDSTSPLRYIYNFNSGTSMAAPHVSGVLALMKSINPSLTPDQIDIMLSSGELTDSILPASSFGHGLLNARKAVVAAATSIGSPPVDTPTLSAIPGSFNFGTIFNTGVMTLKNSRGGSLSITSIVPSAPWIDVTSLNADADGLGQYAISTDRTSLAEGVYSEVITINSTENSVQIPIQIYVSSLTFDADAGYVYILLIDADTGTVVQQDEAEVVSGSYYYSFSSVPDGDYLIAAGSDSDNDLFICDSGESCGAFPSRARLERISILEDTVNLDFPIENLVLLSGADTRLQSQNFRTFERQSSTPQKSFPQ